MLKATQNNSKKMPYKNFYIKKSYLYYSYYKTDKKTVREVC